MKLKVVILVTSLLAVLLLSGCISKLRPELLGKWNGEAITSEGTESFVFDIKIQVGSRFSGELSQGKQVMGPIEGTVSICGKLEILYTNLYEPYKIAFSGSVSGDLMSGEWESFKNNISKDTGEWSAQKQ